MSTRTRRSDWEQRLHAYLVENRGAVFAWGITDCALFAAGAVEAMTGDDPAAAYRGKYRTAAGSAKALVKFGAGTLEATIDAAFEPIGRAFARRGDLVMYDGAVGICVGGDALFVGEEGGAAGLVRVPRVQWSKAWRV